MIKKNYFIYCRETYTQRSIVDSAMLNRLQVEYDEFLVRVIHSLYTTHNRIGWQYLATLPFGMITTQTLWRSYQYLLHTNGSKFTRLHNSNNSQFSRNSKMMFRPFSMKHFLFLFIYWLHFSDHFRWQCINERRIYGKFGAVTGQRYLLLFDHHFEYGIVQTDARLAVYTDDNFTII